MAGCGGGILLFAYLTFVIYKIARRRKMAKHSDPEALTEDHDWAVHVKEFIERRQDGLCMDTISGSTKLCRASIPSNPEAVLQSVTKVASPVKSIRNDPTGKQEEAAKDKTGGSPHDNESPASENGDHLVSQRTEYKWKELLTQSSNIKVTRSRSYYYSLSGHHRPSVVSLKFDEFQGQRDIIRSKSLRGLKSNESFPSQTAPFNEHARKNTTPIWGDATHGEVVSSNQQNRSAEDVMSTEPKTSPTWLPEPDYHSTSIDELVKRQERNNTKEIFEERIQAHRGAATNEKSKQPIISTSSNVEQKNGNKQIARSGSAPSAQAKESVVKRDLEKPLRQRSVSLRWIPEPDYQSVSLEELMLASRSKDNPVKESKICIVEIHRPPNRVVNHNGQIKNGVQEKHRPEHNTHERQTLSNHEDQQQSTSFDISRKPSQWPGVAMRETPERRSSEEHKSLARVNETAMEVRGQTEETTSVRHIVQHLRDEIPPKDLKTGNEKSNATEVNRMETSTPMAKIKIYTEKSLLKSSENPETIAAAEESKVDSSPGLVPSLMRGSEVRSIGKMKILNHDRAPAWLVHQDSTLHRSERENSEATVKRNKTAVPDDHFSTPLVSGPHDVSETRLSTSELVKAAFKIGDRFSTVDINSNLSEEPPSKASEPMEPRTACTNFQDCNLSVGGEEKQIPEGDANTFVSLEEKKKQWKREQIVGQLHNARQRNSNQNYIFGTGLAYQSCMPELQNKLMERTLAK